jgi:Flp pilus assembly pilin Flp
MEMAVALRPDGATGVEHGVAVGVAVGVGIGVGLGVVALIWTIFATEGTAFEFRMNSM